MSLSLSKVIRIGRNPECGGGVKSQVWYKWGRSLDLATWRGESSNRPTISSPAQVTTLHEARPCLEFITAGRKHHKRQIR